MANEGEKPLFDKRLLGTWKSDRGRTFRHWKPKSGMDPSKTKRFQGLFGKLIVRYTRTFIYSGFKSDALGRQRYEVIAKNDDCVVIKLIYEDENEFRINLIGDLIQIRFEGDDGYYIMLFPGLTEYFRRVK